MADLRPAGWPEPAKARVVAAAARAVICRVEAVAGWLRIRAQSSSPSRRCSCRDRVRSSTEPARPPQAVPSTGKGRSEPRRAMPGGCCQRGAGRPAPDRTANRQCGQRITLPPGALPVSVAQRTHGRPGATGVIEVLDATGQRLPAWEQPGRGAVSADGGVPVRGAVDGPAGCRGQRAVLASCRVDWCRGRRSVRL